MPPPQPSSLSSLYLARRWVSIHSCHLSAPHQYPCLACSQQPAKSSLAMISMPNLPPGLPTPTACVSACLLGAPPIQRLGTARSEVCQLTGGHQVGEGWSCAVLSAPRRKPRQRAGLSWWVCCPFRSSVSISQGLAPCVLGQAAPISGGAAQRGVPHLPASKRPERGGHPSVCSGE